MRVISLSFLGLLVSGCAHLSEEQCKTMNWHQEGRQDAAQGKLHRDLNKAAKDCARFNLAINREQYFVGYKEGARQYCTPDYQTGVELGQAGFAQQDINHRKPVCDLAGIALRTDAYKPGWEKGIATFCTTDNGYHMANEGKSFPEVCPPALVPGFRAGYRTGQDNYCNQIHNAFALGKNNAHYPGLCTPSIYPAFKSEYERGVSITKRSKALKDRLSYLDREIDSKVFFARLVKNHTGYYDFGSQNPSSDTIEKHRQVNNMVSERKDVERELFQVNAMR